MLVFTKRYLVSYAGKNRIQLLAKNRLPWSCAILAQNRRWNCRRRMQQLERHKGAKVADQIRYQESAGILGLPRLVPRTALFRSPPFGYGYASTKQPGMRLPGMRLPGLRLPGRQKDRCNRSVVKKISIVR